jgi:hypothetical protein
MPRLLSGSTLRKGGSGEFLALSGAMPQLPTSPSTSTGFTLVTDDLLRTTYRSSLGNLEFNQGQIWSNLQDGIIKLYGTGTGFVQVLGGAPALSTSTGALVVDGGVGISGSLWTEEDIHVNGLTIGVGFKGYNNIVIQGTATIPEDSYPNGQENIAIGHQALTNLPSAIQNIAIGRYALSSGTDLAGSIAIGDSALANIGTLPPHYIKTVTNITIYSPVSISGATNDTPVVITATSHGLTTGTRITINDVVGLTTSTGVGIVSLVNNKSFYVDALNDNQLALYNNSTLTTSTAVNGTLTSWSSYSSSGSIVVPVKVTAHNHGLQSGTPIEIEYVQGTDEINGKSYWAYTIDADNVQLYKDNILGDGEDGTGFAAYISDGVVYQKLLRNNNVAIGTNAGTKLIDGEQNFFFGDNIAPNMTTGSYNFFMGHDVATYMTQGSGNISIMGDNLIDGIDNQVNIGAVFYYNGDGYLQLNADTGVGLGTQSTSTTTGAFVVNGGAGITGDLWVGGLLHANISGGASTASNSDSILVNPAITGTFYIGLTEQIGTYSPVDSTSTFTFDADTGTLSVPTVSVLGSVYSQDGNTDESNLLYSPKVTVSATPPVNPRIGDFWIDAGSGLSLQWIKDGTSTFWMQVGAI